MFAFTIAAAMALVAQVDEPTTTVEGRYKALSKEYSAKREAYLRAVLRAKADAEKAEVTIRMAPDDPAYARKFFALADEDPAGPVASDALFETLQLQGHRLSPEGEEALKRLRRDFATSPKMANYIQQLSLRGSWVGVEPLIRDVLERNPDRIAKGHACLGLAEILSHQAKLPKLVNDPKMAGKMEEILGKERLAAMLKQDPEALLREATTHYERVLSDYADVKYWPAFPDDKQTLGPHAEKWLAAYRELAIGKTAPEIEGKDVDGKVFRLSEYRGKVVALVFWASWCGPCMEQIPHERGLVRRMEARPFALLGVNCDYKPDAARAVMAKESINWPNWYDGAPSSGKIAHLYHLQGVPTVYVLDAKGVIREKDVRGEALDKAIEALLKEHEAQGSSSTCSEK